MHTRAQFRVAEERRSFEALRRYGFATLITSDQAGRPLASRLATVVRCDRAGRKRLFTHMDRRNPQLETLDLARELQIWLRRVAEQPRRNNDLQPYPPNARPGAGRSIYD